MKLISLLCILALIAGVLRYQVYQTKSTPEESSAAYRQLIAEANCFLQERACSASDQQAQIKLSLTPQPVPLMKPVQATLQLSGLPPIESIELKIEGSNMYMGFQTVQLVKQTATDWQGSFSLPVCSESEMHWQVTASLNSASQAYQSRFKLVTQH